MNSLAVLCDTAGECEVLGKNLSQLGNGYVYIMSNPSMPGLFKLGFSMRLPTSRMHELHTTGVPTPFVLEYYASFKSEDTMAAESLCHKKLAHCRVNKEREFFEGQLSLGIATIESLTLPFERIFLKAIHDEQVKHEEKRLNKINEAIKFIDERIADRTNFERQEMIVNNLAKHLDEEKKGFFYKVRGVFGTTALEKRFKDEKTSLDVERLDFLARERDCYDEARKSKALLHDHFTKILEGRVFFASWQREDIERNLAVYGKTSIDLIIERLEKARARHMAKQ